MRRALATLVLLSAGALVPGAATAETRERLTANVWQQAEDREHPSSYLLPLAVTRPFPAGARVCASYENDVYRFPRRGWARLDIGLWRDGARVASWRINTRRMRSNQIDFGCRNVPQLRKGDSLLFDYRFKGMPRLEPRSFSHGFLVNTSMYLSARVEPPPPAAASSIRFLGVEPPFGTRIPPGGELKVRLGYSCNQPAGCNVVAALEGNPGMRDRRGVRPGSRGRTLILRCEADRRSDLPYSGLALEIERAEGDAVDRVLVPGEYTCAGIGFGDDGSGGG